MPVTINVPFVSQPQEYFYGVALVVAAVLNLVLAGMLMFDSNNYIYTETSRYLRSRRLTSLALAVFGVGFLLHWMFMPHFTNLLAGKALSFTYFHIGGVLFSMSHTGLIDRNYFTRRVVVRDVAVVLLSLVVYWTNAVISNPILTYLGSAFFFMHIGYLTYVFYSRFNHIYRQLGYYANYMPNDTDHEVLWLNNSCHLIISFGIGGMLCTVLFHDSTWPFTILLLAGVVVFAYIYKALDGFGAIAIEAEDNLVESEKYMKQIIEDNMMSNENEYICLSDSPTDEISADGVEERIEQWVSERHYIDPKLTVNDALEQMRITELALNFYLERHTAVRGYRQWLSHLRIEESKSQMLKHNDFSLDAVARECGYSSGSALSRSFKAQEGIPPVEWFNEQKRRRHLNG